MKHNLVALSLLGLFLCFGVNAANEPVAGAVLRSDTTVTPKADFNPANLTDIAIAGYAGNDVIVASGVTHGDVVVTAGLNKLVTNQDVRLMESGELK